MNQLQGTDTAQCQDDHAQQHQECSDHSDAGHLTEIPSPLQPSLQDVHPPGTNVKMISIQDHEDTIKRIHEDHEATVKQLQLEIDRLKALVQSDSEESKETKRKLQELPKEVLSSTTGNAHGSRKRPKTEPPSNKHDVKWQARYNELKLFQETHGHCNVPTNDEAYKELSKW
jgi:hypothetical protein